MKTKEELNALKEEVETLNAKLAELTDEELAQVTGGLLPKDYYENIIQNSPEQDKNILQTYKKDIGSDKNAKVIF
ncbi:MAG: bacteriocin [Clostridiales bacterium]|nr:bacteriocin [Candidatus Cacconaster stercorequi]